MSVASMLPDKSQEEINPILPDDVRGKDGLMYCGKCGKPKQFRYSLFGFERVVPCVCKCRALVLEKQKQEKDYEEQMRIIDRLKDSSMMASKFRNAKFSEYVLRKENEKAYKIAVTYTKRFPEMKEKNQGLLFYGPVGTGKSHTAACIANALMDQCISVVMTSFVKILQDIQKCEDEGNYLAILNSATLLIIDDLGAERNTEYALEKIYNVIDSRIRTNKPMVLTTNLELSEMLDCSDIRYGRIYDRILESCYPVEMPGKSFRIIEAATRFEDMKNLIEE